MTLQKRIACLTTATLLFSLPACSSQRLDEALNLKGTETSEAVEETKEGGDEVTEEPSTTEPKWHGKNFTENETIVLNFLQERGITDKYALATVLGNIQQESRFQPLICEGGKMTGYKGCWTGGFGLIQWTTTGRYDGLGWFANKYGLDPNDINTQLRYMVNEREWIEVEHIFKSEGSSRQRLMNAAYYWLGWGIHGNRSHYTTNYINALYMA